MADSGPEPIMIAVREALERSGLSLDDLGVRMGYPKDTARKSAWQFVNKTNDPRFSMLRRFAKALDIDLTDLLDTQAEEV